MSRLERIALVGLLVVIAALGIVPAANAGVLDPPSVAPAWTKTFGNLTVQRYGSGDPPLILIPGLTAGAWTWYDTIGREATSHAVYVVTLAGMSGQPPAPDPSFKTTEASLLSLIQSEKIDRPVIIGHSLGGTLALRFGINHPDLVRGIVSVDGLPVFATLTNATADERAAEANRTSAGVRNATPEQFAKINSTTVRDYVTDQQLADNVAALCVKSDQATVAAYVKDLLLTDLRPSLPKLNVPTLIITPNPGTPLPTYLPPELASQSLDQRRATTVGFYANLMTGTPDVKIVAVDNARHFVMLDQPEAFGQALDAYLTGLK